MAARTEEVTVSLVNGKLGFTGVSGSNADRAITFDYAPPAGDGRGYNGLELLLMSLARLQRHRFRIPAEKDGKGRDGAGGSRKGRKDEPAAA